MPGLHERYFNSANETMAATDSDVLFVHAMVDPCNPPRAIQVSWADTSWSHRVY